MGNWQKRLALQQSFVGREPAQMQLNQRGQKLHYIKKLFKADFFSEGNKTCLRNQTGKRLETNPQERASTRTMLA